MRFKTLLLGSVATFAFAGGNAVAADLSVAEPVDYVRVCDAFGSGFWYIPQTDVCVAIGSRVRLGIDIEEDEFKSDGDWGWRSRADVNISMKKMTDMGPIGTYISFDTEHTSDGGDGTWLFDEGFFTWAFLTVGYTDAVSNNDVGLTETSLDLLDTSGTVVNASFAVDGIGFHIGLSDAQDRWGSSIDGHIPDLDLAIEVEAGGIALLGTAVISGDCGHGVAGSAETSVGIIDLQVGGQYSDFSCTSGDIAVADGWAAGASVKANWTDTFQTALSIFHMDPDGMADSQSGALTFFLQPVDMMETFLDIGFDEDGFTKAEVEIAVQLN